MWSVIHESGGAQIKPQCLRSRLIWSRFTSTGYQQPTKIIRSWHLCFIVVIRYFRIHPLSLSLFRSLSISPPCSLTHWHTHAHTATPYTHHSLRNPHRRSCSSCHFESARDYTLQPHQLCRAERAESGIGDAFRRRYQASVTGLPAARLRSRLIQ